MSMRNGGFFTLCLLLVVLAGCAPDGAKLFRKEGCVNCHRFKGVGGSIGPDLTDVTSRRTDQFIRQQLHDSSMNNPNSAMPSFKHLSDKEVQALIDYLKD